MIQLFVIPVVMTTVFVLSYFFIWLISKGLHGMTLDYTEESLNSNDQTMVN
jgi:hypothetical protein